MSQIKRLCFFGCSITYGTGIVDSQGPDLIWPTRLSNQLGYDVNNLGMSGCSNHDISCNVQSYIQHKIGNQSHQQGDFVIISLTGVDRCNNYYDHNNNLNLTTGERLSNSIKAIGLMCDELDQAGVPYVLLEAFTNYYIFIHDILDPKYHDKFLYWSEQETSLYDMLCDTMHTKKYPSKGCLIEHDHFHNTSNEELFLPCSHPSILGHEIIANKLAPIISEHLTAISDK